VAALGIGVLVAAGSSMYVGLFAMSGDVRHLGQLCLLVFAGFLWVKVANMILVGAVLNAGGDSRFVLIMESLATWVVGVPTAFVGFRLRLPGVGGLPAAVTGGGRSAGARMAPAAFRAVAAQPDRHSP
jgi:Na+-driven multidrug efflux pump